MKKRFFSVLLALMTISVLVIGTACSRQQPPYSIKYGRYGFAKVIISDRVTKEVTEKDFDEILNNADDYEKWRVLFGFRIDIDENTEYLKKDNRYYALNEGLAFEVIGEDTLQLHFPVWNGYDHNSYDVTIFLNWQKLYG